MKLLLRAQRGDDPNKGAWSTEAKGGAAGYQIHTKEETYLSIGIFNKWRGYSLRISPDEVKDLLIDCEEFLAELRSQGWDL